MTDAPPIRNRLDALDLALPWPGAGATPARHRALVEVGRRDLAVGRLAEAHTDAVAILGEGFAADLARLVGGGHAGRPPVEADPGGPGRAGTLVAS